MCKFFSGLIDRNGKTYWKDGLTSHSKIEKHFNLRDDGNYCKWELVPTGNFNDASKWKFTLDEERTPDWWNEGYIEFCRDTVTECIKTKKWGGNLDLRGTAITEIPKKFLAKIIK